MSVNASFERRALRHPSFATGSALVFALLAMAALSLVWTPWPPTELDIPHKLALPSAEHVFGTDSLGRDTASLIMAG
ncbi:MAG: ABC transporter permease, partial [Hyphomicrobiales bacterium]|nr:ABC transporter permease [Hyphomicrobiales bacterium]